MKHTKIEKTFRNLTLSALIAYCFMGYPALGNDGGNLHVTGILFAGYEVKYEECENIHECKADCSEGKRVIGGGVELRGHDAGDRSQFNTIVQTSHPTDSGNGWIGRCVTKALGRTWFLCHRVYAICARFSEDGTL